MPIQHAFVPELGGLQRANESPHGSYLSFVPKTRMMPISISSFPSHRPFPTPRNPPLRLRLEGLYTNISASINLIKPRHGQTQPSAKGWRCNWA